jgi:hypothetical protein
MRIISKTAETIAMINLQPVDPEWNDTVRPSMQSMLFPLFKLIFGHLLAVPDQAADTCIVMLKELGQEKLDTMVDMMFEEYIGVREVLCHNDCHQFNFLVEKKPNIQELETFGPKGSIYICDWEMTIAGPKGKDVGIFHAWPLACALCHAVQGHKSEAYHLVDCVIQFWDDYAKVLVEKGGKDEAYLTDTFRQALGGCAGYMLGVFYMLGLLTEHLPLEGVPVDEAGKAKAAIGVIGIKFSKIAYLGDKADLNLVQLRARFNEEITAEIESLLEITAGRRGAPRRGSVLRLTGRCVSDASAMDEAVRRVSAAYVSSSEGSRRASIYDAIEIINTLDLE